MNLKPDSPEHKILRSSAMFAGLPPSLALDVLAESKIELHPADTTLFFQGDEAKAFYLVLDGWVKLTRLMPNGHETVIGVFTRGQTFGEAIAITGGAFPVAGVTVTESRLIRVPVAPIRWSISQNPSMALAMLASTAQHLQSLVRQIEQLKSRKGPERVAEFLLSLTGAEEGPAVIDLPFDKSLIAGRLGMQPESLSRAFGRLKGRGVKVEGAKVTIRDIATLRETLLADSEDGE